MTSKSFWKHFFHAKFGAGLRQIKLHPANKECFPPDLCGLTEDGKYLSNTYALEHGMNWTGILIEPLTEEVGKFVGKLDPRP